MPMVNQINFELNGEKETIRLNETESVALATMKKKVADSWGTPLDARLNDDIGYEQTITTLTAIETRVARQKNVEYDLSDIIDVVAGNGAWRDQGIYFESFPNGGDSLESWRLDHAQQGATKSQSTASLSGKTYPFILLGKMVSYTRPEIEQAAASGIWNVIEEKAWARKNEFDLRFAQFVFQGMQELPGLLTLPDVETDTDTLITKRLSMLSDAEFQTALQDIFPQSYATSGYTAKPNRFLMPEMERMALAATFSSVGAGFTQGRSRLELLETAFRGFTGDASAKVVGSNFCNAELNGGVDTYLLYRKDPFELKVEMPVPFGVYPGASVDGFNFQDTALAQVSPVIAKYKRQFLLIKNSTPQGE